MRGNGGRAVIAVVTMYALRFGLGGLLLVAGILKLRDPAGFAVEIANFHLLPRISPYAAAILPTTEILLGVGLVAFPRAWRRPAAVGALVLFGVFFVAVTSALVRHINIACGCFGGGEDAISGLTVLRNLSLIAAAVLLLGLDHPRHESRWSHPHRRQEPGDLGG